MNNTGEGEERMEYLNILLEELFEEGIFDELGHPHEEIWFSVKAVEDKLGIKKGAIEEEGLYIDRGYDEEEYEFISETSLYELIIKDKANKNIDIAEEIKDYLLTELIPKGRIAVFCF